jgi:hypothetical protein
MHFGGGKPARSRIVLDSLGLIGHPARGPGFRRFLFGIRLPSAIQRATFKIAVPRRNIGTQRREAHETS